MKKYLKFLFMAMFAVTVLFAGSKSAKAAVTPYGQKSYGIVNTDNIYIYKEADDTKGQFDVTAKLGWVVDALGEDGNYVQVQFYNGSPLNKAIGYVKKNFINVSARPTSEAFQPLYGWVGISQYDNVDVRSTDDVSSVFAIIQKGTKVNIIAQSATWWQVQLNVNGVVKTGYVYRGLLSPYDAFMDNNYVAVYAPTGMKYKKTYQLQVLDACPVTLSKSVTWKSSNSKVATVTADGRFKILKKKGNCTITCTITCGNRTRVVNLRLKLKSKYKFYR